MKKKFQLLVQFILLLIFPVITSTDALSCSAFLMKGDGYSLIGFNENWKSMPGMVVINKKGSVKMSLSWNYLISKNKPLQPVLKWTSKYGSVSFNLLGLDLPCYGINEKGLFIVELFLDKTISRQDSFKPNMFWAQWIQYQLDNCASVNEVVENLKTTPVIDWWPTFPGSHFFISDKKGNTAAIELINGVFQVSSGTIMPVPVLCNEPYQTDLNNLQKYKAFGGTQEFNMQSYNWNDRFSKAAHLIKNYNKSTDSKPVDYAWNILDKVIPGQWQLVADIKNNILYFKSDIGKIIKRIDISKCDFSKKSAIKYFDINSDKEGDITKQFLKLTAEKNDEYVIKGFPVAYENPEFYDSEEYANLKLNLHNYVLNKLR